MASGFEMPDLPSFQVVKPTDRLDNVVKNATLSDGVTPMVGPDGLLVPSARTFASIVNSSTRVFSFRFDEAMRDNFVAARAMKRDAFLLGLFEERVLPTVNREFTLEVDDDRDPLQAKVRDELTRVIRGTQGFDALKRALLEAVWFGRAGVQWSWQRQPELDNMWGLGKWDPIHGDSVQFSFDGYPCILMDTTTVSWYAANGAKYGPPGVGDLVPTDRGGTALQLHRPYWRERFAIHQHLMQKADYFEGELAGSVQGLGLRGMVYWQYVVRTDALTWMLAYMQAVGQMDLLVFNYPTGNAAAEQRAILNAQKVIGKAAIACPRNPQGNWPAVEQIPMNAAGLAALQTLVADYFDRHIERLFVGQSMSSGADKGNGLGGTGRAEFARQTKDEILQFDGNRLDATLTRDFIAPLKRYNFPWAKFPVRYKSVFPDLEAEKKVQSGALMVQMGVPIKADELRKAAGYSRPEPGDDVVGAPMLPPGPGGPPGAPPGGGGGQAPVWMGAPGGPPMLPPGPGAPAMLSRDTNPTRYLGTAPAMGFPGGSNTYIPKRDREEPVGYVRGVKEPEGEKWLDPLVRELKKLSAEDLDGIRVDVNTRTRDIRVDVMDWGDPKIGRRLVNIAERLTGVGDVEELNEAAKPFGTGWINLCRGSGVSYSRAPVPYRDLPYKFCSTQIGLVGEAQMRVLQASSGIPQDALAESGRELDAHVTVLWGLKTDDPNAVAELVKDFGPITLWLGRASLFENEAADVLKFDVESDDLKRLHTLLSTLPHEKSGREYKPHATSCYIQPGRGWEFVTKVNPLNISVRVDGFFFTDRLGRKTWISTTGKPPGNVWEISHNAQSTPLRDPQRYWMHAPHATTLAGKPYRTGQFVPGTTMFTHGGAHKPTSYSPLAPDHTQMLASPEAPPQAPPQPQQGPQGAPQAANGAPMALPPAQAPAPPTGPHDARPGAPPPGPLLTRTPGLSPEDQTVEAQSQLFATQNYGPVRDLYFQTHAVTDPTSGDVRSLTINTGDWGQFLPGYTGLNGPAVAAASKLMSDQLFKEALRNQAGKGNNTMMVLSGGAGAGDTAVGDYLETAEYPLVLDKVGTDYGALARQFTEARAAGMTPEFLYVDRAAPGAMESAIEDALEKRLGGQPPQTDTLRKIAEDNLKARRTALEVLFRNPEVKAAVVDEDGGSRFQRRLITDRWEASQYLSARIVEDEQALRGGALERLKENLIARQKKGEVPADVATALLGEGWNIRPPYPVPFERLGGPVRYGAPERGAFEASIDENPLEATNHLAFADWLDETAATEEDRLHAQFRRGLGQWIQAGGLSHDPASVPGRPWGFNLGVGQLPRDRFHARSPEGTLPPGVVLAANHLMPHDAGGIPDTQGVVDMTTGNARWRTYRDLERALLNNYDPLHQFRMAEDRKRREAEWKAHQRAMRRERKG